MAPGITNPRILNNMDHTLLLSCLGLLLAATVLALLLVPLAKRIALSTGLLDHPADHKTHAGATPYGGGIAIFCSFVLVLAGAYLAASRLLPLPFLEPLLVKLEAVAQLQGGDALTRFGAMLTGGVLMFVLGLLDDRGGMHPYLKLCTQIAAAVLLFASGIRITLFIDYWLINLLLTVAWMVGITNAMNLLDNMDGLSAGVGIIAATFFFIIAVQAGQVLVAATLAVLIGSLLGFLCYNFSPASIFMGDAGSLFLGYLLGALSMAGTYYGTGSGSRSILAVVMPLVVLAIPIFDTISVMVIRWRAGKPLMVGDQNHFSHRLVRLGMSRRGAVLTIYLLCATLGLSATVLVRLDEIGAMLVLLHTAGILGVIALLEYAVHRNKPQGQ
ncbi:MAG: undecaprenyl/decaprenyl-phosphate alpha-N-acetylglucosaminyl 1-phosphate transferase [Planctomycetes bacterium]|nr:undecaprenyl/decaprenyl-phosphate alpha-N-acetylglucosaminyl 1-phosphate transferase [Planctomycetota bacterium]